MKMGGFIGSITFEGDFEGGDLGAHERTIYGYTL